MNHNQLKISLDGGKTFQDVDLKQGVIVKYENTALNRQTEGYPEPVLSNVIDGGSTDRMLRHDGAIPQHIDPFDLKRLITSSLNHRDMFCEKFVEFRKAKWWMELFETSIENPNDIPRVVHTVDLKDR